MKPLIYTILSFIIISGCSQSQPSQKADIPFPDIKAIGEQVDRLVRNEEFDRIEPLFEGCLTKFPLKAVEEERCNTMLQVFSRLDLNFEAKLIEWEKLDQINPLALLALGYYYSHAAWETRGNKFLSKTPKDDIEGFHRYLSKAFHNFETVTKRFPKVTFAHAHMIMIRGSMGESYASSVELLYKKAIEINPYSFLIRNFMISRNVPRWGGSYDLVEQYIAESKPYHSKAPYLKKLENTIYKAKGSDYLSGYEDIKQDLDLAVKNYQKAYEIYPASNRNKILLGKALIKKGKKEKGLALIREGYNNSLYSQYHGSMMRENCCKYTSEQEYQDLFEWHLTLNPDSYRAQFEYCELMFDLKKYEKALLHCQKSLELKPYNLKTKGKVSYIQNELGKEVTPWLDDTEYLTKHLAYIFPRQEYIDYYSKLVTEQFAKVNPKSNIQEVTDFLKYALNASKLEADLVGAINSLQLSESDLFQILVYYSSIHRSDTGVKRSYVDQFKKRFQEGDGKKIIEKLSSEVFKILSGYLDAARGELEQKKAS